MVRLTKIEKNRRKLISCRLLVYKLHALPVESWRIIERHTRALNLDLWHKTKHLQQTAKQRRADVKAALQTHGCEDRIDEYPISKRFIAGKLKSWTAIRVAEHVAKLRYLLDGHSREFEREMAELEGAIDDEVEEIAEIVGMERGRGPIYFGGIRRARTSNTPSTSRRSLDGAASTRPRRRPSCANAAAARRAPSWFTTHESLERVCFPFIDYIFSV